MVHEHFPDKTNFIPHAIPPGVFSPLDDEKIVDAKKQVLGEERKDHFVGLWVNRNARRKMPNDVLDSWAKFLNMLEENYGHRDATLVMHTDPKDQEGPNLFITADYLGIKDNVMFSTDRIDFNQMNVLHNIADFYMNISCNEGFGLGTLEAMMCAKPIIALKTGGMTRQVVDHRDGSENGIGLDPDVRNLVGSQMVPFIYEDHVSNEKVANAIFDLYEWGPEKRKEVGQKALAYARSEFGIEGTITKWDETLMDTINTWRDKRKRWECKKL
jgi:glycosyltransferase involved in cell wall biosynthesis